MGLYLKTKNPFTAPKIDKKEKEINPIELAINAKVDQVIDLMKANNILQPMIASNDIYVIKTLILNTRTNEYNSEHYGFNYIKNVTHEQSSDVFTKQIRRNLFNQIKNKLQDLYHDIVIEANYHNNERLGFDNQGFSFYHPMAIMIAEQIKSIAPNSNSVNQIIEFIDGVKLESFLHRLSFDLDLTEGFHSFMHTDIKSIINVKNHFVFVIPKGSEYYKLEPDTKSETRGHIISNKIILIGQASDYSQVALKGMFDVQ